jgi:hypothetical protein
MLNNDVSTGQCPCYKIWGFHSVDFWDVAPHGSCKNRCLRGTHCLHHWSGKKSQGVTSQKTAFFSVFVIFNIMYTCMVKFHISDKTLQV